MVGSSS